MKVRTDEITQINLIVTVKGTIIDVGEGIGITEHGFCWSTTNNPTIELATKTQLGSKNSKGSFSSNLTGLSLEITYFVRAYATNSIGTAYGNEISFTKPGYLPTVSIGQARNITYNSATFSWSLSNKEGAIYTAMGVCWSTLQNPTIHDNYTTNFTCFGGADPGLTMDNESSITGLSPGTTYYVRAYATTSKLGTAYSREVTFTTNNGSGGETGIVTDIEGNVYNTVTIGTQTWMAENLKTTKYNDGTAIPLVTNSTEWGNLTTPGYCWYNNDEASYKNTYGALYNWHTVNTGKLCPTDWHVPADAEWTTLVNYLGGSNVAGAKMKETGTTHWVTPNTGATNESGFTALPDGNRYFYGTFYDIGYIGYWWSSTEYSATSAYCWTLGYGSAYIYRHYYSKELGLSVRCVRDY